jgi:hypothetical protein
MEVANEAVVEEANEARLESGTCDGFRASTADKRESDNEVAVVLLLLWWSCSWWEFVIAMLYSWENDGTLKAKFWC